MNSLFASLLQKIEKLLLSHSSKNETLAAICTLLKKQIPHYDWVGFYLVDEKTSRELVLGPFAGKPTEHTRIPFGKGICGQAAERKETFIVQDVAHETNYLSCSPDVKAEIVVPIFKAGAIAGELDIDSHRSSPFTETDREFLEKVCAMIAVIV